MADADPVGGSLFFASRACTDVPEIPVSDSKFFTRCAERMRRSSRPPFLMSNYSLVWQYVRMRYLGIDYGEKRIGIALSDEEGTFAFPDREIANNGDAEVFENIRRFAAREGVSVIIVGRPLPFSGVPSKQTNSVEKFGEKMKKALQLPVEYDDEVLSTKLAEREGGSRKINASSAAIILQSYLDKRKF